MESRRRLMFRTSAGDGVHAVTATEMREVDRIAVEETGPSLLQMMEHAGRSMAEWVLAHLGTDRAGASVLVVAGPGGNGGGGVAAARHLVRRVGRTDVLLARPAARGSALAGQCRIYQENGGVLRTTSATSTLDDLAGPDLIVDALFGYGLWGPPDPWGKDLIESMNEHRAPVVSLDLPSGLPADGGHPPGVVVTAHATLTLHQPKPGLVDTRAGRLFLCDLGIPASVSRRIGVEPPDYGAGFVTKLFRPESESREVTP